MGERRLGHRGLTWPGSSWLHRAPVGMKFASLLLVSIIVIVAGSPWLSAAVAALALIAVRTAGVPTSVLLRQLVPIVVMVAIIAVAQILLGDPAAAVRVPMRILAVACAAIAVTLTTSAAETADGVERALTRLRLSPGRVRRAGMLVGLAMRSIEQLTQVVGDVSEARRARGLQRSLRAFAVPTVIAAARYAHDMGEALEARGLASGDDEP